MRLFSVVLCVFLWISVSVVGQPAGNRNEKEFCSKLFQHRNNYTRAVTNKGGFVFPEKSNLFNSSNYAWFWDTIISYDASLNAVLRFTRTYNSFGYPLSQLTEQSQDNSLWTNFERETWTYDSAGNLPCKTNLEERWVNNEWQNYRRQEFAFDSNGNRISWKTGAWDSTGWVGVWNYYFNFNANGLNDSCNLQLGQDTNWVNFKYWVLSYDANGGLLSNINYTWLNNAWTLTNLDTYTNDSNGNMLTDLYQDWTNSAWVNNNLQTLTWDTASHPLSLILQFWENNSWANSDQMMYTYDSFGNRITELDQYWNVSFWQNSLLINYTYDTSNNLLSTVDQGWISSTWQNQHKKEYTYDTLGNSITGKYWMWNQGQARWLPYVGSFNIYTNHTMDGKLNSLISHYFSMVLDSVMVHSESLKPESHLLLFPNPSHNVVFVSSGASANNQSGSITVYNLQGEVVLFEHMKSPSMQIDISGFRPGLYFFRYTNNREVRTAKLVKE
jgi:hypothetical protein